MNFPHRFAQIVTKFTVATIIKKYKVTLDTEKVKLPFGIDLKNPNLGPEGSLWVNFEKI